MVYVHLIYMHIYSVHPSLYHTYGNVCLGHHVLQIHLIDDFSNIRLDYYYILLFLGCLFGFGGASGKLNDRRPGLLMDACGKEEEEQTHTMKNGHDHQSFHVY